MQQTGICNRTRNLEIENGETEMKKQQSKRVIPGFGLTMGVTLAMLSYRSLIPLASLAVYSARLGFREIY